MSNPAGEEAHPRHSQDYRRDLAYPYETYDDMTSLSAKAALDFGVSEQAPIQNPQTTHMASDGQHAGFGYQCSIHLRDPACPVPLIEIEGVRDAAQPRVVARRGWEGGEAARLQS